MDRAEAPAPYLLPIPRWYPSFQDSCFLGHWNTAKMGPTVRTPHGTCGQVAGTGDVGAAGDLPKASASAVAVGKHRTPGGCPGV